MKLLKYPIFFVLICLTSGTYAQYIQVNDTYTAQQLVQDVLIDSPCANVSNFTVNGDTFSPGSNSYGYFTNPSSTFPFSNGIVLSTARAKRSEGPNNNLIDEGSPSWNGDADLEQALVISDTYNATILEFDFTPLTSQVSFDYIFASEEYSGSAPCQYSDGFAFLLRPVGSSAPYQNLAVLPNSNTPVLVTTVHPEIGGSCPAENEEYFGSFNPPASPTNYNGQTVVLTARANVIPGTLYHIKLVIADEENIRYDSAIFLGGGSFHVGTDIGPDRLVATNNPVCEGETHILDATEPGSNTYQWFKNNVPLLGETNPTYSVTTSGTYTVEVNLGGGGCIATGEVVIEYTPLPVLHNPTEFYQCDDNNDGITTFNLRKIDDIITTGNPSLSGVVYYESLANAKNEVSPILNPSGYQNTITNVLYARVENAFGCANFAQVNLHISNNAITPQNPMEACDDVGAEDGITAFDLSILTPQILSGLPSGLVVKYYASAADAVNDLNPLPNNFTNTTANQQVIFALIANGNDCFGIIPITLIVHAFDPNFEEELVFLCNGTPKSIGVANTYASYSWSSSETGVNSITVASAGTYSVTVTDVNGCSATKNFIVTNSETATITSVTVNDFTGNNNSLTVHFSGNGHYEFSLDGNLYQDSPLFTGVPPGEYFVYINDINGCGITPPHPVTVMDYPRFFTPNGDGYNDIWQIKNLNSQPNAIVNIFDRYGKLVYSFKGNGYGWNGRMRNITLPSDDYWFTITLENGKTVKSHFSLKR